MVMSKIKTRPTGEDVTAFLDSVADERRRAEGHADAFVDGAGHRRAGDDVGTIDGRLRRSAVHEHDSEPTTGSWSASRHARPRMTIYGIHDGYAAPDPLLDALGPHTTGKSCVYVKRLDQVDQDVLEQLVRNAWRSSHEET